jgi:hypothetical protein
MVIQIGPAKPGGDLWLQGTATEIVPHLLRVAFGERS